MTEPSDPTLDIREEAWMIRPCLIYNDEYKECKSIKGRFHQYFIHGETLSCDQWKTDHNNCKLWRDKRDETAYNDLIASEHKRRTERLAPHYGNTVWKKREEPPADWNRPIPEWMQEKHEKSYLAYKAAEMADNSVPLPQERSLCTIS